MYDDSPQHKVSYMVSCCYCGEELARRDAKACSQCHSVRYCSKQCQRLDWKEGHKEKCRILTAEDEKLLEEKYRAERVVGQFNDLIKGHTNEPLFQRYGKPAIKAKRRDLISLQQFWDEALINGEKHGCLVVFETIDHCEKTIVKLAMTLQGSLPFREYPPFPNLEAVSMPPEKRETMIPSHRNLQTRLPTGDGFVDYDVSDTFFFGTKIELPLTTLLSGGVNKYCGRNHSNPIPANFTASQWSFELARYIEKDGRFRECRKWMKKIQKGRPGVLWLKNFFANDKVYHKKQLKDLDPEALANALEAQVKGANEEVEPCAVYSLLQDDKKSLDCPFITECWPSILKVRLEEIRDPNIVFGFFLTYLHSHTTNCLVTEFAIRYN